MGMQDRDWYKEVHRERRRRAEIQFSRAAKWAMFREGLSRTVVNCLAVYGAVDLFVRAFRTFAG